MKKLLLVCSNYWPEIAGIGIYSTDLAENAFSKFFDVTVLTGLPHYPWWKIPDEHKDKGPGVYQRNGVEVLRVGHVVPKSSGIFGRAQLEFSFWRSARRTIRKIRPQGFDLVVAIMPTVASGLVARDFARRQGIDFQVVFQDISSVGAKQSGMPAAKWLANIPRLLEKRAVSGAKAIAIVSPAMRQQVEKIAGKNVPVTLIHNYSLQPKSKISKIEGRNRLQFDAHEFIFLHTGNIGYKQDLLNVVAAGKLVKNKLIKIYIVGHGNQENVIKDAILNGGKAFWLPSVLDEDYPYLLASGDVLLINERASQMSMSLPSKITSYLSANRPILAAVPSGGASSEFLSGIAHVVDAGSPESLARAMDFISTSEGNNYATTFNRFGTHETKVSRDLAFDAYHKWTSI